MKESNVATENISVQKKDFKIVFALGAGGAGKSTILNALGGSFKTGFG